MIGADKAAEEEKMGGALSATGYFCFKYSSMIAGPVLVPMRSATAYAMAADAAQC
jgi:hypothetical protein